MRGGVNMSGWAGFSEDELRRMSGSGAEQRPPRSGPPRAARPPSRRQLQRDRALKLAAEEELQAGQKLSDAPLQEPGAPEQQQAGPAAPPDRPEVTQRPAAEREERPEVKELDEQEVAEVLSSRLQVLQQQQSHMEEQNRVKKELLTRTLQRKSQQTQAEATLLRAVKAELQQLETTATSDIIILRARIEEADREYSKTRKRYERAEAEFVASKLELHRKTEVKERLAEHLYAIIQQKELRKARKLEELMLRLALKEAGPGELLEAEPLKKVETTKETDSQKEAEPQKEAESPQL